MDTNNGIGHPADSTDPLEVWAPPVPGTAYATAVAPVTAPPARPVADPWTSPLWGRPDTVGGYWPSPDSTERVVVPPATPLPAGRRTASRGLIAAVATVIVAMLVGFGAVRAISHNDSASVASPPSSSVPPITATDPTRPDPNAGAQDDPLQGLVPGQDPQTRPSQGPGASSTADPAVVAAVAPSIVNITTTIGYDGNQAAGTGEVMTEDGFVLTNHHVIAGSTSIKVAVAGTTKTYDADVVGYDASRDIAVIKLRNASGMTPAPFGDSSTVQVGDTVIGMGNAGGANGTPIIAAGKVTGLDKSITAMDSENGTSEQLEGLIETDAQIQPGDSGGSLVSGDAKIIGIITAGSVATSPTGKAATTDGYAIPVNEALAIAQDIRDGKASDTVHIGASAFLGIKVASSNATNGVTVSSVVNGSAAAKAGITAGSTITRIDGTRVTDNASLRALIAPHHPGDSVTVSWTSANGKSHSAKVTFGNGPVA